jgi:hypothetical protein
MSPTQLLARLRWLLDDARALGLSDVDLAQAGVSHALLAAAASGDLGPWTTHAASQLARRLGYDDSVLWREEGIPGQHLRGYRGPAKVLVASDEILMRGIQSVLEALAAQCGPTLDASPTLVAGLCARSVGPPVRSRRACADS